jgi:lipopolysaccharide transport system ATP-binding protein
MLYGAKDIASNMVGLSSHSERLRNDEFWAVDDVSFELRRGETLGLIGSNGSGKSTMLKMINGIFMPDKGSIEIKGRVGALIEVGAGFHPMLTGRENIYVNGSILGMSKKEIDRKFDEIVKFADIGDFIDAPVKHYSSGMYVRLGFAIAVHCEPEILLVDEILSVGDISFRQKSFEKINEMIANKVSIIFVSHSMYAIRTLSDKVMCMFKGKCKIMGEPEKVIEYYQYDEALRLKKDLENVNRMSDDNVDSDFMEITKVHYLTQNGDPQISFYSDEPLTIRIEFDCYKVIEDSLITIAINRSDGILCCNVQRKLSEITDGPIRGKGHLDIILDQAQLNTGSYTVKTTFQESSSFFIYSQYREVDPLAIRSMSSLISAGTYPVFTPISDWKIKCMDFKKNSK